MKPKTTAILLSTMMCCVASATQIDWMVGAFNSNLLVLNGSLSTYATFTPNYEMRMMYLGEGWTYSSGHGFSTFVHVGTGSHYSGSGSDGKVGGFTDIADDSSLNGDQYMVALYEKSTGKYFFVSETLGGAGIEPYTMENLSDDPFENGPPFVEGFLYYPIAANPAHRFYKGAEIPPFCGWLAGKGLVQSNLSGLNTNTVNTAFAVNANPTNFSSVAVSITDTDFAANSISGAFSFMSYDSANNPTTVTKLNGTAALSLLSSTSLTGSETTPPATFNLPNGTFQSTSGATAETQFLRLRLTVPEVW